MCPILALLRKEDDVIYTVGDVMCSDTLIALMFAGSGTSLTGDRKKYDRKTDSGRWHWYM